MPKSNKDPSILSPKKSIKEYCLFRCKKDGKTVGSKRDVIGCMEIHCPLYHYRTGILKSNKNILSKREKSSKLYRLERARREVATEEKRVESIKERYENAKLKNRERYFYEKEMTETRRKNRDWETEKTYGKNLEDAQNVLEEKRNAVKRLEDSYEEQLSAGLWGDVKTEELTEEETE